MSQLLRFVFFLEFCLCLCSCLLLRLRVCGTLRSAAEHRSGYGPYGSAFARVPRDCAYRGSPGSPTGSAARHSTLRLSRILCCSFLGSLYLFSSWCRGTPSLRVEACPFLSHSITIDLIVNLLMGALTILRKCKGANELRRGPSEC